MSLLMTLGAALGALGSYGSEIVFTVSSFEVLTFTGLKRTAKGRWTVHDVLGGKPYSEFLGPDAAGVSLTINLNYQLGVYPKVVLKKLRKMAEEGQAEYLVIGGMPVCDLPMKLTNVSEEWNTVYGNGFLAECDVTIDLEEYR